MHYSAVEFSGKIESLTLLLNGVLFRGNKEEDEYTVGIRVRDMKKKHTISICRKSAYPFNHTDTEVKEIFLRDWFEETPNEKLLLRPQKP